MLQFTFETHQYISVPPNQNSFKVVYELPNGKHVMLDPKETTHDYFTAHEVIQDTENCTKVHAHLLV